MKSKIGRNSLLIAISGFIFLEMIIYFEISNSAIWRILATAFEAATIGGLADWFAVSALFYEIPIPYVRKHTNIIVKSADKEKVGLFASKIRAIRKPEPYKGKGISYFNEIILRKNGKSSK